MTRTIISLIAAALLTTAAAASPAEHSSHHVYPPRGQAALRIVPLAAPRPAYIDEDPLYRSCRTINPVFACPGAP